MDALYFNAFMIRGALDFAPYPETRLEEINGDPLQADFLLLILDAVANAHDEALVPSLATVHRLCCRTRARLRWQSRTSPPHFQPVKLRIPHVLKIWTGEYFLLDFARL
jgi:hypothetical protein